MFVQFVGKLIVRAERARRSKRFNLYTSSRGRALQLVEIQ